MATTTAPAVPRQSTRVPTKIRLAVTSLNPTLTFSETCDTVSVNSFGCAMHSPKEIAVNTPVLLKLPNGKEAAGQVVFCKASSANDKWGLGVELDSPGNFWGFHPCPPDWLLAASNDAIVAPPNKLVGTNSSKPLVTGRSSGPRHAEVDAIRVELREQMRKEVDAFLKEANAKLADEIKTQQERTASIETQLSDSEKIRHSLTAAMQSAQGNRDQKTAELTEKTSQQIKDQISSLTEAARSETEQLQKDLRKLSAELKTQGKTLWEEFEVGRREFVEVTNRQLEEKKQGIADAAKSVTERSDQIYNQLEERLQKAFSEKQRAIRSSQDAAEAESKRIQVQLEDVNERIAKFEQLSATAVSNLNEQLDHKVADTISQTRTNVEVFLEQIRNEQVGKARTEVEGMITPVSARADSLVKELLSLVEPMTRERDEIQTQIDKLTQEKKEIDQWFAGKNQEFRKVLEEACGDARIQGKKILQESLDMLQDPVDKLNREAKNKIEEGAARQYAQLGEGVKNLRGELAALQQRTSETLRASLIAPEPVVKSETSEIKPEPQSSDEGEKPGSRSNSSFAQKISGLVRGSGAKRE